MTNGEVMVGVRAGSGQMDKRTNARMRAVKGR